MINYKDKIIRCINCNNTQPEIFGKQCIKCGSSNLELVDKYITKEIGYGTSNKRRG